MDRKREAFKAAFPHTLPVLAGFLFLGTAYGILMSSKGFGAGWTLLMSAAVYAGSMQYVAIPLLAGPFSPGYALLMTLIVNARHAFYGISMLRKFEGTGNFKPYLIFAMCDETFSVLCSAEPPEGVDRTLFMFFVTLLNQLYWVAGSLVGSAIGGMLTFDAAGLDFSLTALFVVIFVGQWKSNSDRRPALIGLACSITCLAFFGSRNFVLPAMAMMFALLSFLKEKAGKEAAV